MKRKMKLLLADLLIAALTLIFGGYLYWTCMVDLWKAAALRLTMLERFINRASTGSIRSRKTLWKENKQEGEQLI